MTRLGTAYEVVDVRSGEVLSRHRDRDDADRMWGPELESGEVRVIDLTDGASRREAPSPRPSLRRLR